MDNRIKDFVNDGYLSFNFIDLIFRIIGYFVYSFIMTIVTELILTDILINGFVYISLTAEYVRPLVLGAIICSTIISVITIVIFMFKTKWSVIAIKGISLMYISFVLLALSCFSNFTLSVIEVVFVIIKILAFIVSIFLYERHLLKKIIPNFDPITKGRPVVSQYACLAPALLVLTKPLLIALVQNDSYAINFYSIIIGAEFICGICFGMIMMEFFTKAYYAKKYNIK